MNKKLLAFISIFSLGVFSFAQQDDYSDYFFKDYISRIWTTAEGLQGNTVTDLMQDSEGYLYIGTYEGLVRFDGVKFLNINRNYDPRLNFLSARTFFEDSKGMLWVGANDEGVTAMQLDGTIYRFNVKTGLPNNSVRAICEDKEGNIWIGTSAGLACVSKDMRLYFPEGIELLPKENSYLVTHLFCDQKGRVWVTTSDSEGAFFYEDNAFHVYSRFEGKSNRQVTAVFQDSTGTFWYGFDENCVVKEKNGVQESFNFTGKIKKGSAVSGFFEDSMGNIWVSTDGGIAVFHDNKWHIYTTRDGLADEKIVKITEDHEHNIWIGTDRGGVQKLTHSKMRTSTIGRTVNSIVHDKFRNVVWLGCDDGVVCIKDGKSVENEVTEKCRNVRVRHVDVSETGNLYVSCYEVLGQLKYDLNGKLTQWTKQNGLAGNRVRVAQELSNGDVYVGTTTGLSIIDGKTGEITNITRAFGIENDYIMCIQEMADGSVWVGTDGGGVFVLKNRQYENNFKATSGLAGNVVFKILEINGDIWVCTGTGLSIYRNDKFTSLDSNNGLGTDSVFQAIYDGNGRIWCTSNRGIFSVKLQEIYDVIDEKSKIVSSRFYGANDGVISGGVTSTSKSCIDSDNKIWFTLIDGFCIYEPIAQLENVTPPVVHIEEVISDQKRNDVRKNLVIVPPCPKRVSITYTGISFIASDHVSFRTKLDGFDKDFSEWTNERSVSYTNLSPGTYKFYLIAQNSDGISSGEKMLLTLIVKPAFYQRVWFWILIVIAGLGLLYLGIQRRVAYLKATRNKLEELVQERTKELTTLQHTLEKQVSDRTSELRQEKERVQKLSYEVTKALAGTIDAKDKYTNGHSVRVAEYSKLLAAAMGKNDEEIENIYYAGLLHDIGKIGVPDTIINKPDKLTDEEFEIIKTHPVIGSEILKSIESMPEVSVGARWHHERFDGRGYPDHLKGYDIPELARIICVADAYDAMTSNRSYRKYLPQEAVRKQIEEGKGVQFDPAIADKMLEIIDFDTNYDFHEKV